MAKRAVNRTNKLDCPTSRTLTVGEKTKAKDQAKYLSSWA
jgi:hypothetical protein